MRETRQYGCDPGPSQLATFADLSPFIPRAAIGGLLSRAHVGPLLSPGQGWDRRARPCLGRGLDRREGTGTKRRGGIAWRQEHLGQVAGGTFLNLLRS